MTDLEPGEDDVPYTHREIFFDSENRVGQGLATFGGHDHEVFEGLETIDDVSSNEEAMDVLVDDERVYVEIARSITAMESQSAHQIAMDRVAATETVRDVVRDSDLAFGTVAGVNMAIGKFVVGDAGLDPTEYADMDAVAASETAMDTVAASEAAMDTVAASETAMDTVTATETAMDTVAESETAMDVVMASEMARTVYAQSDYIVPNVWERDTPSRLYLERNINAETDEQIGSLPVGVESQDIGDGDDDITWTVDRRNEGPNGGWSLGIEVQDSGRLTDVGFYEFDFDLSDASSIDFQMYDPQSINGGMGVYSYKPGSESRTDAEIQVSDTPSSWTEYSIDTSTMDARHRIGLFVNLNPNTSGYIHFANFELN